jgi:hypothetical protein
MTFIAVPVPQDPCNPSPCGANAQCRDGVCTCLPEYRGDPYSACRPECVQNPDCPLDKVCLRNKCYDPCTGVCAQNAKCTVINHTPMCSCPDGMSGNAFAVCFPIAGKPMDDHQFGNKIRSQVISIRKYRLKDTKSQAMSLLQIPPSKTRVTRHPADRTVDARTLTIRRYAHA